MESITDKIRSIRETVGATYSLPDPARLEAMISALFTTSIALDYLRDKRGLKHETIEHFRLGYSHEFHAIAIPVFKSGVLVNIKYRYLNPVGKARYTSEPGCESWMYNEEAVKIAKSKKGVLIVEGEFDCMRVWQSGIPNVVSPSSGKDSFGPWLELIEDIPKIYIGYDNDSGGKESGGKMADRLGVDRCFEVTYPGVKDASEFLDASPDGLKELLKTSPAFTSRQFKTLGDIIESLRKGDKQTLESSFIPNVEMEKGWMVVISGRSNVGKTAFVLNIADEFTKKGIPTLVLPFERGIESVGERFLQVMSRANKQEMAEFGSSKWDEVIKDAVSRPLYFAMPSKEATTDFIIKSKRYFDTKVVIIDHLDYMVRQVSSSRGDAIMDTLQNLKRVCEDNGIILLVVSHIRKIEGPGQFIAKSRKPNIEDLKGSSSLYQDPEAVVMLSEGFDDSEIVVDVVKNKGTMGCKTYSFDHSRGLFALIAPTIDADESPDIWNVN